MRAADIAPRSTSHLSLDEARRYWESDRSLTALLIFLVFSVFIADPLSDIGVPGHVLLAVAFTAVLLSGVLTIAKSRTTLVLFSIVAVGSLVVHWERLITQDSRLNVADALSSLLALGLLAVVVLLQVFREGPITVHRIQGAISVYLLLGLMWAAVFALVYLNDPQSFSFAALPQSTLPVIRARFVYFSFTTLTTVGYGDITAVSPIARSLAMLEAVTGQLFPAILIARLVSMEIYYRQRRFEREQAALDREELAREVARVLREQT
jgi:hypothetical protein